MATRLCPSSRVLPSNRGGVTELVIIGAGGQARELLAMIEGLEGNFNLVGFLDDDKGVADEIHGVPVLGDVQWLRSHPLVVVAIGIGLGAARLNVVRKIRGMGPRRFPGITHPGASVGPRVNVGEGVLTCAGAILTTDIAIGDHVLLNFACTVGHDAVIEDFATIAPGAHVSGAVRVGEGADIGTGSSILQGVSVGEWAVVGAGAVVVHDVLPNTTVVGVPARVIEERQPGWHLEGS